MLGGSRLDTLATDAHLHHVDALERTDRRRVLAAGALMTLLALDAIWGYVAWRALSDGRIPLERWQASAAERTLLDALSISFLVLSVASGVTWMIWQYAAHESLWQRSVPGLRRKPSVVAWWLLPFVGLFTAGFAVGEIVGVIPRGGWASERAVRLLLAVWWFCFFLFTMSPRSTWDAAGGPIDVSLSANAAITYALASLFALPLVWMLDRGVDRVLPWHEPAPKRQDVLER
jgi:hypothetical protein